MALLLEEGVGGVEKVDDAASELDASRLLELLLVSGLLAVLLGWVGVVVSAGAPPQAESNTGAITKNVRYISFLAHLYIDKHLRFKLCRTWLIST